MEVKPMSKKNRIKKNNNQAAANVQTLDTANVYNYTSKKTN